MSELNTEFKNILSAVEGLSCEDLVVRKIYEIKMALNQEPVKVSIGDVIVEAPVDEAGDSDVVT